MFEWGGGTLWCGNDACLDAFDVGPIEDRLPLTDVTRQRLVELSEWHNKALNWEYPGGPSPWDEEAFLKFEETALSMKGVLEDELGEAYEVVYVPIGSADS